MKFLMTLSSLSLMLSLNIPTTIGLVHQIFTSLPNIYLNTKWLSAVGKFLSTHFSFKRVIQFQLMSSLWMLQLTFSF